MKADCPLHFIDNVVNEFQKGKERADGSFRIPASLCKITKTFIFIEIPTVKSVKSNQNIFRRIFTNSPTMSSELK